MPETYSIQYAIAATSLNDLGGAPQCFSSGAACAATGAIQGYSSRGPSLSGVVKPDISARSTVSTSLETASGDCISGFSGTSATAPQVAGAAALYKQALGAGPARAPQGARDRRVGGGSRRPGKDNAFGSGLLSVNVICGGRPATMIIRATTGSRAAVAPTSSSGLGGNDGISGLRGGLLCGRLGADNARRPRQDKLFGQQGRDKLRGGPGHDKLIGGPGRDKTESVGVPRTDGGPVRPSQVSDQRLPATLAVLKAK